MVLTAAAEFFLSMCFKIRQFLLDSLQFIGAADAVYLKHSLHATHFVGRRACGQPYPFTSTSLHQVDVGAAIAMRH